MKSVRVLLKKMNESDKFDSDSHSFRIYSDGSGGVYGDSPLSVDSWGVGVGEGKLENTLNRLEDKLNEDKESWTL
jgi:hypothetical protein